jgi:aminoglycoside 3-N-acetyltransferase I
MRGISFLLAMTTGLLRQQNIKLAISPPHHLTMTITKLGPADLELARQLLTVFQQAFEEPARPCPADTYLQELLSKADFHVLAATDSKGLVMGGVSTYELTMFQQPATEMFLYDIAVAENCRQRGVAAALIEALKAICRERGIKALFVGTDTDNAPALRLYQATGGVADEQIAWFNYTLE